MNPLVKLVVSLVSILLLTSCIPSLEIERLGVINTRGFDISEENKLEATLVIFQFEAQSQNFTKIVSGEGNTIKDAITNAGLETNFVLAPGKIQLDLFGREVAEKGIMPYLDTSKRDANIPDTMFLSITNQKAKDLLTIQEQEVSMNIGQFLHGLIEENSYKHQFPKVSLQDFFSVYYDAGKDPFLPMYEIKENKPYLAKIAILQDDRLVGEISSDEMLYFNFIEGTVKDRWLGISIPKEPLKEHLDNEFSESDSIHTAYNVLKGTSKTKLIDMQSLTFETEINLEVNMFEISEQLTLDNREIVKIIEKEAEKKIQSNYEEIFSQLQEMNADPFGYGTIYRTNKKGGKLEKKEWREKFPEINVDFKVNFDIIRHGITN